MVKNIISCILILTFILLIVKVCDGKSFSQSFKITVVIPPHVSVSELNASDINNQPSVKDSSHDTIIEEVARNKKKVILKTTVAR